MTKEIILNGNYSLIQFNELLIFNQKNRELDFLKSFSFLVKHFISISKSFCERSCISLKLKVKKATNNINNINNIKEEYLNEK